MPENEPGVPGDPGGRDDLRDLRRDGRSEGRGRAEAGENLSKTGDAIDVLEVLVEFIDS